MSEGYTPAGNEAESAKIEAAEKLVVSLEKQHLEVGQEEEFLESLSLIGFFCTAERESLLAELELKVTLALANYGLFKLREKYKGFLDNPSRKSVWDLDFFVQHQFVKIPTILHMFAEAYPTQIADIDEDFFECCQHEYTANVLQRTKPIEGESSESFAIRAKQVLGEFMVSIDNLVTKYGSDERFAVDPYALVTEIREDVAKYRQEHPKT